MLLEVTQYEKWRTSYDLYQFNNCEKIGKNIVSVTNTSNRTYYLFIYFLQILI